MRFCLKPCQKSTKSLSQESALRMRLRTRSFPNLVKKAQNHGPKNLSLTFKNVSCISGFLWDFFVKWLCNSRAMVPLSTCERMASRRMRLTLSYLLMFQLSFNLKKVLDVGVLNDSLSGSL